MIKRKNFAAHFSLGLNDFFVIKVVIFQNMLIRQALFLSAYLLCAIDVSLLGSHHFPLANGQMVPELYLLPRFSQ